MVTNLKSLIINQIKAVYGPLKVYDEPVRQGLITPAFLVFIFNNHQERQLAKRSKRTYSFNVTYFPESDDKRSECDAVFETFQNGFRYINNQYHVHEVEGVFSDDVLVITFEIKTIVEQIVDETKMRNLTYGGVTIV